MQTLTRIFDTLTRLAITGFCLVGFLATFEYPETSRRLPWQIGYGGVGVLCLSGIVRLLRSRPCGNPKQP